MIRDGLLTVLEHRISFWPSAAWPKTSCTWALSLCILQSWTKVLGTALQYSYFHVISRFPLKTVHPFRNSLVVLPPPTLYKVETRKNSGYTRPTLFVGWVEGLDLCELENTPETQKCHKNFVHNCSFLRTDAIVVSKWNKRPPPPPQMGLK